MFRLIFVMGLLFSVHGKAELLCPTCSQKVLSENALENNVRKLWMMKNEIFAIHGHQFNHPDLQDYFENQDWYQPKPGEVSLSEIEKQNVTLLDKKIKSLNKVRQAIIEELNALKQTPSSELSSRWNIDFPEGTQVDFLALLQHLDLSAFRNEFYTVRIDDGVLEKRFHVLIEGEKVILSYHEQTSEQEPWKEYDEWLIQWNFKLENDKLIFKKVEIAG